MPKEEKIEKNTKLDVDITNEAIKLVESEISNWEDALVFVTDKVAFRIRHLIRTLRKNYWGIFDKPDDPVSNKPLTWIPITEIVCDAHVKNTDLNTKDINTRAKKGSSIGLTTLVRNIIRNWLDDNIFGEKLDESERQMAIDGSFVWKTFEGINDRGKTTAVIKDVDLLNLFFDMTSDSLQKAFRVTERALLTPDEVMSMDGWMNTEDVKGTTGLHPTDPHLLNSVPTSLNEGPKLVDVYELWGKIPEFLITGKKEDTKMIEGHLVVSGLEGEGDNLVHLIETNPDGKKPYEEAHTKKIKGRWLARGPAESVMMLQVYLNMIVNIRKIRAMVSQLGIFKIKKQKGITPQMLSRLAVNGAILVNDMDDIQQMAMDEASESSYKDESTILDWAQRVTSTFESATGEPLPASTSATGQVIQARAANSSFLMFKNNLGFFLQRWIKRHALTIIMKNTSVGDIIRMTDEIDEVRELDNRVVNYMVYKELDRLAKEKIFVNEADVIRERERALKKLSQMSRERYIEIVGRIDFTQYDVQVFITNEEIDKSTLVNNLLTAIKFAPQFQETIIKHVFDLMGLDAFQLEEDIRKLRDKSPLEQQQQAQPLPEAGVSFPVTAPEGVSTEQKAVTAANVI